jgi:hypothetical protein
MVEEDIFGIHGGIRLKGIVPIPLGLLLMQEILLGPGNSVINATEKFVFSRCYL